MAVGLGALAAGLGAGAGVVTVALVIVRLIERADVARYGAGVTDVTSEIMAGVAAGLFTAALLGWRRSAPIGNGLQRAIVATLAAFGALIVAFLLTEPVERLAGFAGLVAFAALCFAAGVAGAVWAWRNSGAGAGGC